MKDFRNFHEYENDYNKNCNIIYGKNGSGKTNLLESISLFDKGTGFKNDNLKNIIRSDNSRDRLDNLEKELQNNSKDSFIQKTTLEEKI